MGAGWIALAGLLLVVVASTLAQASRDAEWRASVVRRVRGRGPRPFAKLSGAERAAVLAALRHGPMYGNEILECVQEETGGKMHLHQGNLYDILRDLEADGGLESYEGEATPERGNRPRRYYRLARQLPARNLSAEVDARPGCRPACGWCGGVLLHDAECMGAVHYMADGCNVVLCGTANRPMKWTANPTGLRCRSCSAVFRIGLAGEPKGAA